ncbi:MAG: hypothetical protein HN929_03685 [Chloroflexi bacterium]|jgi:hypothetical protein|nr:hypothetical protein [Chloroflexota bacterium]MBT7080557.1 hypothetical protein [Chloroflexota bacterium]MBT7289608.1 hypothetical protein [Chloroflexota bacterium]
MEAAKTQKEQYECLDPRGTTPERTKIPLTAPRIANLDGKNVLVVMRESFPNLMPAVHDELQKQYPKISAIYWDFDEHGGLTVEQAKELKIDAAIVGVGY